MEVQSLGEFATIEAAAQIINQSGIGIESNLSLLLEIGDDAAAWQSNNVTQLATTDILIENIHFTMETTSWIDLGWKALAVNISHIAAIGRFSAHAMNTFGFPTNTKLANIEEPYRDMAAVAGKSGMSIVGGDITSSLLFCR